MQAPYPWLLSGSSRGKLGLLRASCFRSVILGYCRFGGDMEEADSATKAFGLVEPPIIGPPVEGVGSETESEAEVATMAVMPEPGNIDIGAESMPNSDEASYSGSGLAPFRTAFTCSGKKETQRENNIAVVSLA